MKWSVFKKSEIFKNACIVKVIRRGKEVDPLPFDVVITAYPVVIQEYPHLPAICAEIF